MGAVVKLHVEDLKVTPGTLASCEVVVCNDGSVVDQLTLDVVGAASSWASVTPPTLSLFPGAEGKARINFSPPRLASVAPGPVVFGLRAQSHEDPEGSAVEEGQITVLPFSDTGAELIPRTSRGRRSAVHEVALDNRGNSPVNASIEGEDPDRQVRVDVTPPSLTVEPGTASFAKVRVSPAKRFWRGQSKTRAFQLAVADGVHEPIRLQGTMLQEAMLPSWLGRAAAVLLVAALALGGLWFMVLQPSIQSTAREQVNQGLAQNGLQTVAPNAAGGNPSGNNQGGGGGASQSPAASPTAGTSGGTSGGAGVVPGKPTDGRLYADQSLGATSVAANKTTLYVTDLVFSNPNARTGMLQLKRGQVLVANLRLDNFRDYDLHFVTPVVVPAGQSLQLAASSECTGPCDVSVYYSGFTTP